LGGGGWAERGNKRPDAIDEVVEICRGKQLGRQAGRCNDILTKYRYIETDIQTDKHIQRH